MSTGVGEYCCLQLSFRLSIRHQVDLASAPNKNGCFAWLASGCEVAAWTVCFGQPKVAEDV